MKKNKGGRPSSYKSEFTEQAYRYSLLGATDEQMAVFFGVTVATVYNWKNSHPEFLDATKRGKAESDAKVAEKLFNRAMGYSYTEKKTTKRKVGETTTVEVTETEKQVAPDTTAQIFWLKNRQPAQWRDKQQVEHSGGVEVKRKLDLSDVDDETLAAFLEKAKPASD